MYQRFPLLSIPAHLLVIVQCRGKTEIVLSLMSSMMIIEVYCQKGSECVFVKPSCLTGRKGPHWPFACDPAVQAIIHRPIFKVHSSYHLFYNLDTIFHFQ